MINLLYFFFTYLLFCFIRIVSPSSDNCILMDIFRRYWHCHLYLLKFYLSNFVKEFVVVYICNHRERKKDETNMCSSSWCLPVKSVWCTFLHFQYKDKCTHARAMSWTISANLFIYLITEFINTLVNCLNKSQHIEITISKQWIILLIKVNVYKH